jgi:hypothetical protein
LVELRIAVLSDHSGSSLLTFSGQRRDIYYVLVFFLHGVLHESLHTCLHRVARPAFSFAQDRVVRPLIHAVVVGVGTHRSPAVGEVREMPRDDSSRIGYEAPGARVLRRGRGTWRGPRESRSHLRTLRRGFEAVKVDGRVLDDALRSSRTWPFLL